MRFMMYQSGGQPGVAAAQDQEFFGLSANEAGYPGSLLELLTRGADLKAEGQKILKTGKPLDPEKVAFLPPLPRPGKIVCVGLNYTDHAIEAGFEPPDYPAVFPRYATTLAPHKAPLVKPKLSDQFDYEAELVAVIGKTGRAIPKDKALEHVAGYSNFNEASLRDYQKRIPQWTLGKNFDNTGGFGPWIVTADALPAGADGLRIQTRLNGRTVQDGRTSDMIFKIADLVSIISATMTLEAGDILVTGTPAGVGLAHQPPLWMKDGDVCEIEIEGIGILRNPIKAEH